MPSSSRSDAVVIGDLAELDDLDLAGHLLAAPDVGGQNGTSGFGVIHSAGIRLRSRTAASRRAPSPGPCTAPFDFDAFEVDLLVLDLDEARRRSLVTTYVPYVEEFGLTFREILLFEVGPHRVVLPERWHVVPNRSAEKSPAAALGRCGGQTVVRRHRRARGAVARGGIVGAVATGAGVTVDGTSSSSSPSESPLQPLGSRLGSRLGTSSLGTVNRMVLVTGASRSGTSTIAGVLNHLGLDVPQPVLQPNHSNPNGFFESTWPVYFHNRLIKRALISLTDARPEAFEIIAAAVTDEDRASSRQVDLADLR